MESLKAVVLKIINRFYIKKKSPFKTKRTNRGQQTSNAGLGLLVGETLKDV